MNKNTDKKAVRPFATGSQYGDWLEGNCMNCAKGIDNIGAPGAWPTCEIEAALAEAYGGNGNVTPEMAARMGWERQSIRYIWRCGEWQKWEGDPVEVGGGIQDGKVVIHEARQVDGLVFSVFMMLIEAHAVVGEPWTREAGPKRDPGVVLAELAADGCHDSQPVRIYEAAAGPDMVAFNYGPDDWTEARINLNWWCQLYTVGLDVAQSKKNKDIFLVLNAMREPVGAVMGMYLQSDIQRANVCVVWEAGDV